MEDCYTSTRNPQLTWVITTGSSNLLNFRSALAREIANSTNTMKLTKKNALLSAATLAVLGAVTSIATAQGDDEEIKVALPAATMISAINAAVAAQPGNVAEVEAESEDGVTKVEVEIVAADGKRYEVDVSAQTGKVIAVEADDDGEENEAAK